ncbi:MAG TPA: DUF362 domain-containing protein [Phycisphaerae bacterium]|jgi:uncharacterized protein (DUF362 family)
MVADNLVAIAAGPTVYGAPPPYSPDERLPEYPLADLGCANPTYLTVRESLRLLGLDAEHFGTARWNPLGARVRPGDTVVLKPNFVREFRETQPGDGECTITHGSVIRAVLDYVFIALQGRGRIIIADAPNSDADFDQIRRIAGLNEIQAYYRREAGFEVEVYDLRPERARKLDGVIVGHEKLPGDPAGYVRVNLGLHSAFAEINGLCRRLYGAEYDMGELHRHQHDDVHEYLISKTVLAADCVISLPKLKTHKKAGLTANMKNLVGINGNKNWLPHHREGTPAQGGDQFADDRLKSRLERLTLTQFKRVFPHLGFMRRVVAGPIKSVGRQLFGDTNRGTIRSGNWYGNDTTWRMVLDLNRILFYAHADGNLRARPPRRLFSVVDAVVAGEGNGPLDPTPRATGLVIAGAHPVAVDLAGARLMGFDYGKLPVLHSALEAHPLPLAAFAYEQITALSNDQRFTGPIADWSGPMLAFEPHFGWRGHIELTPQSHAAGAVA